MLHSLRRIGAVAGKELRHLRRDELSRAMILGIPLVMTLLFGYAINHDVRHLPAAVVDQAETSGSRLLLAKIQASRVVDIVERFDSVEALETRLPRAGFPWGSSCPPISSAGFPGETDPSLSCSSMAATRSFNLPPDHCRCCL